MRIIKAAQLQYDFPVLLSASQHPKDSDPPKYTSGPPAESIGIAERMAGVCGVHSGVVVGKPRMRSCAGLCMMALPPMRRHIGISAIANISLHTEIS